MRTTEPLSLTEGRLLPSIVRFSVPLMLSNVLQVLFNMSDVAVVGGSLGRRRWGRWARRRSSSRCSRAS